MVLSVARQRSPPLDSFLGQLLQQQANNKMSQVHKPCSCLPSRQPVHLVLSSIGRLAIISCNTLDLSPIDAGIPRTLEGIVHAQLTSWLQWILLSQVEVEQNVLEMLLAGTDTSSVTMFFTLVAARDDPLLQSRIKTRHESLCLGTFSPPSESSNDHEEDLR